MEIKKYVTEQLLSDGRYQRINQNIPRGKWRHKYGISKSMGCSKNSSKVKVNSDTDLPQKMSKISNKQFDFTHTCKSTYCLWV